MNKILTIDQAVKLSTQFKQEGKTIVLAGGCFDILHVGHVFFLNAAKRKGDSLFVLLESDENVKIKKGKERPINSSEVRAIILSGVQSVDYIIPLTGVTKDEVYDRIMVKIKPDIVAMTKGDGQIQKRSIQCKKVGAKLKLVIKKIENISTTALINQVNY